MKTTPISVLLANLSDIFLAGISNLVLEVERPQFQIAGSTSIDRLVHLVGESRPHFLLIGLPRKGVDAQGQVTRKFNAAIVEVRKQFQEVIVVAFAVPDSREYQEAIAFAQEASVADILSFEIRKGELVSRLRQIFLEKAKSYKARLRALDIGDGGGYESLAEEILPFLFKPHFIRFESQVWQGSGNRPDFVCRNNGQHCLCQTILRSHQARYIVLEIKNEATPKVEHLRQLAAFLKPNSIGNFGVLIARQAPKHPQTLYKRLGDLLRDEGKMVIVLHDDDILEMLDRRIHLLDPIDYLEERYDHFVMHM